MITTLSSSNALVLPFGDVDPVPVVIDFRRAQERVFLSMFFLTISETKGVWGTSTKMPTKSFVSFFSALPSREIFPLLLLLPTTCGVYRFFYRNRCRLPFGRCRSAFKIFFSVLPWPFFKSLNFLLRLRPPFVVGLFPRLSTIPNNSPFSP